MKKAIALFFCLQILSGNAFAMELAKLPAMVQHYFEHERDEHPDLTFMDFLAEHYLGDAHQDEAGKHCDETLPFKHCNDCCTHSAPVSAFTTSDYAGSVFLFTTEYTYSCESYTYIPAGFVNGIWQPPKVG